jgi:hypothetical protein
MPGLRIKIDAVVDCVGGVKQQVSFGDGTILKELKNCDWDGCSKPRAAEYGLQKVPWRE